jgi:hypothetical protein
VTLTAHPQSSADVVNERSYTSSLPAPTWCVEGLLIQPSGVPSKLALLTYSLHLVIINVFIEQFAYNGMDQKTSFIT